MADDAEQLQRLRRAIREILKARSDLEQSLANPDALRSATARAYRDRDAVTSPLLEEARDKVTADVAAFNKQWQCIDTAARHIDRLDDFLETAPEHIRGHRDAIVASLPGVREARARIAAGLRAAGLEAILPENESSFG